jgi:hypothetical protein
LYAKEAVLAREYLHGYITDHSELPID